ncbi:nucleoside phosphorylase domain-containing protein [Aspergillus alliaceus]|uniref:Nucleoside phosphorylase domain-containing protein n=1 Tax=Petromyces alliaceus TaxID=209559 RepID=A0A5N7BYS6_PETAA|nr:nucleoside phosphorylase domain-containing protein [Aspergillus alliaceus]
MASLTNDDYTIAWICALLLEMAAARVMLDRIHNPLPIPPADPNAYVLGELNGHRIVVACLPVGVYGIISAATVVSHVVSTFPRIQFGLMVGIGGGVPSTRNDIRLGDVVVSKPIGKYSGVIQYDYGKAVQGRQFKPTGTLNKPPQTLLTHMVQLEATQMTRREDTISIIVWEVLEQNPDMKVRFSPPQEYTDYLFRSSYRHVDKKGNCENCDKEQLINRQSRDTRAPYIHYGLIASGDKVMKDSEIRDHIGQRYGILCFEMEAAGLMDKLPTLAIRGICDYCDSHKQKQWQGYAALTAAAYTKMLLGLDKVW